MSQYLPFLFFLLIILILICVAFLCLLLYLYNPARRRRRLLAKQARLEYGNARGTAHLKILKDSRPRLANEINNLRPELEKSKNELKSLELQQSQKLRVLLETQIIHDHFDEISGIGSTFRDKLLRLVYRSNLSDLRHASSMIHGIGDARQIQINAWVDKWETQIWRQLQTDFPGRANIEHEFRAPKLTISTRIEQLEKTLSGKEELLKSLDYLVKQLGSVSPTDFYRVLIDPSQSSEKLDFYLRGAFAEWESIPGWFKQIVGEVPDHA
jgi:cbb3-type cytochrome oxidase subunit 3